jgi:serine protease
MRLPVLILACLLAVLPAAADVLDAASNPFGLVPAAPGSGPSGPEPSSSGQVIVGFAVGGLPPVQPGEAFHGFEVLKAVENGAFLVVRSDDVGAVRDAVAGETGLVYVEDDLPMKALVTPNDPRVSSQYGVPQTHVDAAWSLAPGYGSSSIKVAILDTGMYRAHEDFTPASRFLTGYDYVQGDSNTDDDCGHGTHVTGTVAAATNNGKGVAGMSQATILPLRVLSAVGGLLNVECTGSTSTVAQAIRDAADQGARVISMSIGGGASTTLQSAVDYAWSRGAILVAAAGNDGASNSIDYPGAYDHVVAVGATTSTKARASFSDMGPQLDVMAPGDTIWSTTFSSTTSYGTMSGTSMATPHVSGILALALSCAPSTTNAQAVAALTSTAEDLGAAGFDTTYGYGLVRADRLVQNLCGGGGGNAAPTACFSHSETNLATSVNGGCSSDSDGSVASWSWNWGDGSAAGSGSSASHTYAAAGTYTVTLTVTDNGGATGGTSQSVTVASGGGGGDPDPSTPNLSNGVSQGVAVSTGSNAYYKIQVPSGSSQLKVEMTGPSCGLLSCSVDADLYTRFAARPTDSAYDCRPFTTGNAETCTHASPATGWWYVRVNGYSGSGTVSIKATIT